MNCCILELLLNYYLFYRFDHRLLVLAEETFCIPGNQGRVAKPIIRTSADTPEQKSSVRTRSYILCRSIFVAASFRQVLRQEHRTWQCNFQGIMTDRPTNRSTDQQHNKSFYMRQEGRSEDIRMPGRQKREKIFEAPHLISYIYWCAKEYTWGAQKMQVICF